MGRADHDASSTARSDDDLRRVRLRLASIPQLAAFGFGDRVAGPVFLWGATLTNVLLGALLAVVSARAWAEDEGAGWAAGVVAGGAWVVLGVAFGVLHLRRPRPADGSRVRVADVGGRPGVVLAFSRTPPRCHAWGGTAVAVALVGATAAARGSGAVVPLGLLAAVVVACVPDLWARVARGGHLVLTPDGVHVRGGDGDGTLAWDDVVDVRLLDDVPQAWLVIAGRPGTSSWRPRRGLLPRVPARRGACTLDALVVPLPLLDVRPSTLPAALGTWVRHPGTRAELGDDRGRHRLVGTVLPGPW